MALVSIYAVQLGLRLVLLVLLQLGLDVTTTATLAFLIPRYHLALTAMNKLCIRWAVKWFTNCFTGDTLLDATAHHANLLSKFLPLHDKAYFSQ